jgi:small-conductance mechanosensitive channel
LRCHKGLSLSLGAVMNNIIYIVGVVVIVIAILSFIGFG